ncbi:cytochrome C oxidase subunit IV family protein [Sediminibacterium soli]|uniref:cytochrome C oxidase subunit IV family protein n=1 Tax=Sediminibacterium soli TaxID=2698829 RepID=UPI0013798A89|nr:cytochrome C oxidase subunit IV family protein [Sediminibacterium soli]NCI45285.1 cytochrome C oxidase subunit IV family protein [Sediminibacterium soli]
MEHTTAHEEHGHGGGGTKEIVRVTIILSVLTVIELALGFWMISMPLESSLRLAVKGAIIILMLAKAFYIVGYFMHLKHEVKNLIMTIVVPLALFIWFIIAFLSDGNSFRNLRNTYDPYFKEKSTIKVAPAEEHGGAHGEAKHEEKKAEEKHEEAKPEQKEAAHH